MNPQAAGQINKQVPAARVFPTCHNRFFDVLRSWRNADISASQVIAVACFLLFARVVGLDRQSLWFDEGYTLSLASSSSLREFLHRFGTFTTSEHLQPLYYILVFLWSRIAGTSDFALRFPSVLCSVASGLVVFVFARRLVDRSGRVARWFPHAALFTYCISSFAFYYAQEARPYALLQFISFGVIYLWIKDYSSSAFTSFSGALVLASVLATLTSPFGALLVSSLAFADIVTHSPRAFLRWRFPILASGACFILYVFLGHLLLPPFLGHDVVSIRQSLWMNLVYGLYGLSFGTTLGPSSSLLHGADKLSILLHFWPTLLISIMSVIVLAIGAVGILRRGSASMSGVRVLALATLSYSVGLFMIFGAVGHLNVLPRHASALFTMLFFLSLCCASQASASMLLERRCLFLGAAGVLALNIISVSRYWADPSYRKDDYRAVAAEVSQRWGSAATPVFLVAGDPGLFRHYGVSLIDASNVDPKSLAQFLLQHSNSNQSVQIIFNEHRGYRWDRSAPPAWILQPVYECSEQEHLAYMQILTCERTARQRDQGGVAPARSARGSSYAQ